MATDGFRSRGLTLPLLVLALLGPWSSQRNSRSKERVLFASAAIVNFTLDDTSSLIAYSPITSWRSSTTACGNCLAPDTGLAYAGTWHDGTHIIPTVDGDDEPGGSNDLSHSSVGGASSTSSAQASEKTGDKGDDDDNDGNGDDKHKGGKGAHRRHLALAVPMKHIRRNDSNDEENPFFTEKEDSDDAGFVDQPVSMSIDFVGASI